MARIRSMKPEFWEDRKMARVSRDARLLYLSLWNQADEWARIHGDARWIKGHCLPYEDDLDLGDIDRLIGELVGLRRVQRYEVEGEPYLFLPTLGKHQRLEPQKTPSRLPEPPSADESALFPEQSGIFPDSVTEPSQPQVSDDSENFPDKSGKIVVQQVAGSREHVAGSRVENPEPPRAARGHRIPDDFTVTDSMRSWAQGKVPGLNLEASTEKFINHFTAKGALMKDWPAAWRNWMLTDYERMPRNGNGAHRASTTDARVNAALAAGQSLLARQQLELGT